jgi:hypothetical protein
MIRTAFRPKRHFIESIKQKIASVSGALDYLDIVELT